MIFVKQDREILESLLISFDIKNVFNTSEKILFAKDSYQELSEENLRELIAEDGRLVYVLEAYKKALDSINFL